MSIDQALELAVGHHRAGRLQDAEMLYRAILAAEPRHPDAQHNLGLLALQSQKTDAALYHLSAAVEQRAPNPEHLRNLIEALVASGREIQARDLWSGWGWRHVAPNDRARLSAALSVPDAAEWSELDRLAAAGDWRAASSFCRRLLARFPTNGHLWRGLGAFLHQAGESDLGFEPMVTALVLLPGNAEALNNLGNAFRLLGAAEVSARLCRHATRAAPLFAEACSNLGTAATELRQFAEAERALGTALAIRPSFALALANIGFLHAGRCRFMEGASFFRRAVAVDPANPLVRSNLASAAVDLGDPDAAESECKIALALDPGCAEARHAMSFARLAKGDFARGWKDYEARRRTRRHRLSNPDPLRCTPYWSGEDLSAKKILVFNEQGLGDTLQFCRFVPKVAALGGRVILQVQRPLKELMKSITGAETVIAPGDPVPEVDFQVSLLSLPALFETDIATIPAHVPYLDAEPERIARWRDWLGPRRNLRIGIAWQGNPDYTKDALRSMPLRCFSPIAQPDIDLVSLQKHHGLDQIKMVDFGSRLIQPPPEFSEGAGAFVDTAALLLSLDLVIAPDSAVAHLAGALGRPTCLALQTPAEWRWMEAREDTPWYPTVRLFRQSRAGDWDDVMQRIASMICAQ